MNDASMPPSIFLQPAGHLVPSTVRATLAASLTSRRSLLKGFGVLFVALATASIDMLPRIGSKAAAAPATRVDCNYPDSWKICNPDAAQVSGAYCDSTGYHRTDATANVCESRDYVRDWRCGPIPTGGSYNAWVWRKHWGPDTGAPDVRCSDGKVHAIDKDPCRPYRKWTFPSTCKVLL
ncbi:hypothetical protein [Pimelobacter simplex]|uniref:hypothetical protein n=1 Tax=Nocardioides simplex TaxID=2045 RepID=UPI001932243B|nr:hypothetical protein [Pimelobacter simplex]